MPRIVDIFAYINADTNGDWDHNYLTCTWKLLIYRLYEQMFVGRPPVDLQWTNIELSLTTYILDSCFESACMTRIQVKYKYNLETTRQWQIEL